MSITSTPPTHPPERAGYHSRLTPAIGSNSSGFASQPQSSCSINGHGVQVCNATNFIDGDNDVTEYTISFRVQKSSIKSADVSTQIRYGELPLSVEQTRIAMLKRKLQEQDKLIAKLREKPSMPSQTMATTSSFSPNTPWDQIPSFSGQTALGQYPANTVRSNDGVLSLPAFMHDSNPSPVEQGASSSAQASLCNLSSMSELHAELTRIQMESNKFQQANNAWATYDARQKEQLRSKDQEIRLLKQKNSGLESDIDDYKRAANQQGYNPQQQLDIDNTYQRIVQERDQALEKLDFLKLKVSQEIKKAKDAGDMAKSYFDGIQNLNKDNAKLRAELKEKEMALEVITRQNNQSCSTQEISSLKEGLRSLKGELTKAIEQLTIKNDENAALHLQLNELMALQQRRSQQLQPISLHQPRRQQTHSMPPGSIPARPMQSFQPFQQPYTNVQQAPSSEPLGYDEVP